MSEELKAAAIKAANRMRDNHKEVCRVMMPHADEPKLWEESTDRANVMARYILSPHAPGPGFDAEGWRQIETAPKDGTHILAGWMGECWLCFPVKWRESKLCPGLEGWHYLAFETTVKPTHWMPLPPAPNERTGGKCTARPAIE